MGKLLMIKDADFSDVAVTRVTPVNPDSGGDDSGEWKQITPSEMLTNDDSSTTVATANYMFGTTDMIFSDSDGYSKVSITLKYRVTTNLNVYLIELPDFDEETSNTIFFTPIVAYMGDFNAVSETEVTQEFTIPSLDDTSAKYIIGVLSTNDYIYLTMGSNIIDYGLQPLTVNYSASTGDAYLEKYKSQHNGWGTFIYSYFQMKFK